MPLCKKGDWYRRHKIPSEHRAYKEAYNNLKDKIASPFTEAGFLKLDHVLDELEIDDIFPTSIHHICSIHDRSGSFLSITHPRQAPLQTGYPECILLTSGNRMKRLKAGE